MALETLKGKEIPEFVIVNHETNEITFKIQDGPIGENGLNGCQVDQMIAVAREIIGGLNEKFPCRENNLALTKLDEAILWLKARTANRINCGVEGKSLT